VEWNNSTLRKEVVPAEIEHLKQEPGRDMLIYGSASIIQTLTNHGLIDEYQVLVHPVLLGAGKPLWSDLKDQVKLHLINTKRTLPGSSSSLTSRESNATHPP